MKPALPLFLISLVFVAACGGGGATTTSTTVTGTVYDQFLVPVIGAKVEIKKSKATTTSSTSGAFILDKQPNGYVLLEASYTKNGTVYRGSTIAYNASNSQTTSVGLMVAPETQLSSIEGIVTDSSGAPLQDASVFLYNSNGGVSKRAITGDDGTYFMNDVPSGVTFTISATGQTYRSDQFSLVTSTGSTRVVDFVLRDGGMPVLAAPTNLSSITYVSHPDATRGLNVADPLQWVKARSAKPGSKSVTVKPKSRIRTDINVEAQLDWLSNNTTETQGFGIYRSLGTTTNPTGYDYLYDPLATTFFDAGLQPNSTYSYGVTITSSWFPDVPSRTESDLSNVVQARTLERLSIGSYSASTKRFSWGGSSGATSFVVYLFDEFPAVDAVQVWDNESAPSGGTSVTYNGPSLQSGRTYYWFVMGSANGGASRTISQVGSFKA